jgi:hypothetical protein
MAVTDPTIISGGQTIDSTGGGNTDRFKPQVRDEILMYGPNINPVTLISSKVKTRSVGNPVYKVMHDKRLPRFDNVNNGAGYNTTATSIVVDDGTKFAALNIVKNTRTGEQFKVSSVSTNTLTVVRGYDTVGAGTGVTMLDDDELLIISITPTERAAPGTALVTDPTTITNYIQRFSRVTDISWLRKNADEYGKPELQRIKEHATFDLKRDIELAFKFGKPLADIGDSSPLDSAVLDTQYQTFGLQYAIDTYASANAYDAGGVLTQTQLWQYVQPLYENMPDDATNMGMEIMALCSASAFRVFASWGLPHVEISQKDKEFGLALNSYQTPVGKLTLVQDYSLSGTEYGNWMFLINPSDLGYVYHQGLDIQLNTDAEDDGTHRDKDELFGYIGFECGRPELHAYIKNVDLAA